MAEPEVALVFTPEEWVEELHRHLTDHGGARVRQLVVEPSVALEESYDVLVASHRWPALTRAFVADVHALGRTVLGVFDREEPAGRAHLTAVGVDRALESDSGPKAFVDALVNLRTRRAELVAPHPVTGTRARAGRIVVVGGPSGTGRTELAIAMVAVLGATLVDGDDVAPSIAQRLGLPIEPNLRTAIDAVEHGRGDLGASLITDANGLTVLGGLPNPGAWAQIRPGEVVRVVEQLARDGGTVVVDGPGPLEDIGAPTRGRHAVGRALLVAADALVAVCAPTPVGVARFLAWMVEAQRLAPQAAIAVVVNRAPGDRFRRGELFEELTRSLPPCEVVFTPDDRRVTEAVWNCSAVAKGPFRRAVARLGETVPTLRARIDDEPAAVFEEAS